MKKSSNNPTAIVLCIAGGILILALLWKVDIMYVAAGMALIGIGNVIQLLEGILMQIKQANETDMIRNLPKAKSENNE